MSPPPRPPCLSPLTEQDGLHAWADAFNATAFAAAGSGSAVAGAAIAPSAIAELQTFISAFSTAVGVPSATAGVVAGWCARPFFPPCTVHPSAFALWDVYFVTCCGMLVVPCLCARGMSIQCQGSVLLRFGGGAGE